MDFLSGKGEQDPKDKRAQDPQPTQMKKSEAGPKEVTAEGFADAKQVNISDSPSPLHKNPSTQEGSSKKSMTRAERKSFDESHDILQKHMQKAELITSPPTILKPGLGEIPEISLEDGTTAPRTPGTQSDSSSSAVPSISQMQITPGAVFVIGIAGGANSGKTFCVERFVKEIKSIGGTYAILKERDFLKPINIENAEDRLNFSRNYDYDSPLAVDWELMELGIKNLSERKPFNTPIYSVFHNKRLSETFKLAPSDFVIVEGRMILHQEHIRKLLHFTVYLDAELDLLLSRRIYKSIAFKIPIEEVIDRYNRFAKPNHEKYTEPSKVWADATITNFRSELHDEEEESTGRQHDAFISLIIKGGLPSLKAKKAST